MEGSDRECSVSDGTGTTSYINGNTTTISSDNVAATTTATTAATTATTTTDINSYEVKIAKLSSIVEVQNEAIASLLQKFRVLEERVIKLETEKTLQPTSKAMSTGSSTPTRLPISVRKTSNPTPTPQTTPIKVSTPRSISSTTTNTNTSATTTTTSSTSAITTPNKKPVTTPRSSLLTTTTTAVGDKGKTPSGVTIRKTSSLQSKTSTTVQTKKSVGEKKPHFSRSPTYQPSEFDNLSAKETAAMQSPPNQNLKLDFVYGYGVKNSFGNNLHVSAKGTLVYYAAGTAIEFDKDNHTQRFFTQHTDDITCISMHQNQEVFATSQLGKRPLVLVWDIKEMKLLSTLEGQHKQGVSCVAFSVRDGGKRLVSIGQDTNRTIVLWDWAKATIITSTRGLSQEVLCVAFNPVDDTIVVCGQDVVKFFTIDEATNTLMAKKGRCTNFPSESRQDHLCVTFDSQGRTITGTSSGSVYIWENCEAKYVHMIQEGPVRCLLVDVENNVLLAGGNAKKLCKLDLSDLAAIYILSETSDFSGNLVSIAKGRDGIFVGTSRGEICHVRSQNTTPGVQITFVHTLLSSHYGNGQLWGLCTLDKNLFFTCGDDNTVRMWDYEEKVQVQSVTLPYKCRRIDACPKFLVVGCFTGQVYVIDLDVENMSMVANSLRSIADLHEEISVVKLAPNGRSVVIGTHDSHLYLIDTENFEIKRTLKGHSSFITSVDFSEDSTTLRSTCGAYELLFWDLETGTKITHPSNLKDYRWATHTCLLAWTAHGAWQEGSDGTDVNSIDVNKSAKLLASGDDFGKVNLFRFPTVGDKCVPKQYAGHSSHVTKVVFSPDEKYLLSAGGGDLSVLQWKIE